LTSLSPDKGSLRLEHSHQLFWGALSAKEQNGELQLVKKLLTKRLSGERASGERALFAMS
jgi:hypothetical protein